MESSSSSGKKPGAAAACGASASAPRPASSFFRMLDFQLDLLEVLLDFFQDRVGGNGRRRRAPPSRRPPPGCPARGCCPTGEPRFRSSLPGSRASSSRSRSRSASFLLLLLARRRHPAPAGPSPALRNRPFPGGAQPDRDVGLRGQRGRLRIGFQLAQELFLLGGQLRAGRWTRTPGPPISEAVRRFALQGLGLDLDPDPVLFQTRLLVIPGFAADLRAAEHVVQLAGGEGDIFAIRRVIASHMILLEEV